MPSVAIVGRPNVGKSSLFNKLAGARVSIVDDTPGVTRDRVFARCEWNGRVFSLVDTGGIEPRNDTGISSLAREQALFAARHADVVVLVCCALTGVTADDAEIASLLLRMHKNVVLCANKADSTGAPPPLLWDFYSLGLGEPLAVSALHGHGTGDLLDACVERFPVEENIGEAERGVRVAIIGKPNVGKSSLLNRLLGEHRSIVSDEPGTTRDAVDGELKNEHGRFVFTDTAGLRRRAKVSDNVEYYSVLRAVLAIERSDVCVLMLDALSGVTEQDTKIAGLAHDAGKPTVIAVNKWDLAEKDEKAADRHTELVRGKLAYMSYAPVLYISALTGRRTDRLYGLITKVYAQSETRVTTGLLNDMLSEAVAVAQPPTDKGRRLKVFYMTQAGVRPPHFVAFCNDSRLFHYSYRRYLENNIRKVFGFDSVPIRLTVKERGEGDV